MSGVLGLAILLILLWILLVGAVHVTGWVVNLLVIAGIVVLIVWLLDRSGPRTRA
jgi:hypothetical protein